MTVLDDSNIDAIHNDDKARLILFYSNDIPTIKGIKAIFEDFERQLQGKVIVMTCELEKLTRTREYYQLNTLPAILFIKDGKAYGNLAGPASKAKYESIVKEGLVAMMKDKETNSKTNSASPTVMSFEEMYGQ
jgi:thioredoxin-like negative regulator of GroEL